MSDYIDIAGNIFNRGDEGYADINLASLPSRTPVAIRVFVSRSNIAGPTVLLTGGIHGDEINGVEIVRRLIVTKLLKPKIGTIIATPLVNVHGMLQKTRQTPDGKDLNRSFPGNKNGSLASQIAHFIHHSLIPIIDYGLDFHSGTGRKTNFPQIRCNFEDQKALEIAEAFEPPYILNSPPRENSYRKSAKKLGKTVLVFEGGTDLIFDEFAIKEGMNGTLRVLEHLNILNSTHIEIQKNGTKKLKSSAWHRAKYAGFFKSFANSGDYIKKRDIIGEITDPFGEFSYKIKATDNGYLVGLNLNGIIHKGEALYHIAK